MMLRQSTATTHCNTSQSFFYANFGDTFVEKYYFEDNPISPMATKKDLARIVAVIEKQNITEASEIGASWRAGKYNSKNGSTPRI